MKKKSYSSKAAKAVKSIALTKKKTIKSVNTNRTKSLKVSAKKVEVSKARIPLEKLSYFQSGVELKPSKKISASAVAPAVVKGEQIVSESKFYVHPPRVDTQVSEQQIYELPAGYGDNKIVIQVRDPYWLHSYWEITQDRINLTRQEFGDVINNARNILRVYDVTAVVFNGTNANKFFDIEINSYANNWYINVGVPGRSYCVDIGLLLPDGKFITLARSNTVSTPIDGPSWITDEEWMVVEEDFNRLYGLSIGLGLGLSSADVRKKIKELLKKQISSGALFSISSPVRKVPPRGFWLVVNTELIVYGATEPDAYVTVQGRPIKLNSDGTFSLRFALPDGEQVIPVKAVSYDKVEERVITPIVTKRTE